MPVLTKKPINLLQQPIAQPIQPNMGLIQGKLGLSKTLTGNSTAFIPPVSPPVNPLVNPMGPVLPQTSNPQGPTPVPPIAANPTAQASSIPTLPENYGFNDLAGYEEARHQQFGEQSQKDIEAFAQRLNQLAGDQRTKLASSLTDMGQQQFSAANPFILQDLNSRGLATSPTAIANSQADALKQIALSNQKDLLNFDENAYSQNNDLLGSALSARLQGGQEGLDSGLDLRRGQLESQLQNANAAREQSMAEDLAKQGRKNGITQSLIGAGSNLLGNGGLGSLIKGIGGLFGGGAPAASPSSTSLLNLTPDGLGSTLSGGGGGFSRMMSTAGGPLGYAGGLIGGGYAGQNLAKLTGKNTNEAKLGSLAGAALGQALIPIPVVGGILGGAAGGLATKAVQGVGKAIKKFCFDGLTFVTMANGDRIQIKDIGLGEQSKGGMVESVRISITADGTLYNYKGVKVTGSHAVKEDGKWIRVEDSTASVPVPGQAVVYSLMTSDHRIYVNGIEFADETEVDEYEDLTINQCLEKLNEQELVGVR